MVHFDIATG